jgi:hypothetical protein
MSRFAHTLTATLLLSAPALGQGPAPPPAPWANKFFLPGIAQNPAQPAPLVVEHDFGTVPKGTLGVHKFTVTNIYDVPIQVIDIRRTCGCLEAFPPERVLQPNEQADFVVTMDTGKFTGPNAQTMYVTFGPQYVSTAVLRFQAESRADVMLNPGRVHFGTVAQGSRPSETVAIDYQGPQRDWQVTGVVPPAGPLDVTVKPASAPGAWLGKKYQVTVALKPDAPAGPVAEVVALRTNDPASPVVYVNVTGLVQAPLSLSTSKVQFGTVKLGEAAKFRVLVRATAPFRVRPVPDAGDGVSVETFPQAIPVQAVEVTFRPTKPGALRKVVELRTDLNGGATAVIVVEGTGESPAP